MKSKNNEFKNQMALDLALIPSISQMQFFYDLNQLLNPNENVKLTLNSQRIPHLTLYQGFVDERNLSSILSSLEDQKNTFLSFFNENQFTFIPSEIVSIPFRESESIFMMNFNLSPKIKEFQNKLVETLSKYQILESETNLNNLKLCYYDENVQPEISHWIFNYAAKNNLRGFSPHVTLGFAPDILKPKLTELWNQLSLNAIHFDTISLGLMGDYCTFSDKIYWKMGLK